MLQASPTVQCIEGSEMSVKYDLFPAYVSILPADDSTSVELMSSGPQNPRHARHLDKARVIVYQNKIVIATDSDNGPRVVFQEKYDTESFIRSSSRDKESFLTTVSGKKLAFRRNDACGCGSRLRSWNPYTTVYSKNDPTE